MAQPLYSPAGGRTPPAPSVPSTNTFTQAENLWDTASQELDEDDKQRLQLMKAEKLNVLEDVLDTVKRKRQMCLEKRWAFTKRNGERIILRDVCEKVIVWVDKFKQIGDVAVQYDPGHASLPWAGVRFILQAAVNDQNTFHAMMEGVEHVTYLITRCAMIESLYLDTATAQGDSLADSLDNRLKSLLAPALVSLYAAILQLLAKAGHYYRKGTASRVLKSLLVPPEIAVKDSQEAVLEQEKQVMACLQLLGQDSMRAIFDQNREACNRLDKLRSDLENPILRFATHLSEVHDCLEKKERQKLLRWLSEVRYADHHKFVSATRMIGSGSWLLEKPCFIEWRRSSSSSILWLHGIPGSGKTHLVSLVIDELVSRKSSGTSQAELGAFFYCNRNPAEPERSDPEEVMRCVLKQLCSRTAKQPIRAPIADTFLQHVEEADDDGLEPSRLSLCECTELIIKVLEQDPAIIIIDALDECDPLRRHQLLAALDRVIQESAGLVKVFVASRDDGDIKQRLSKSQNIYIDASDNSEDIEMFVQHELENSIESGRLLGGMVPSALKDHIQKQLVHGAHGMFRWVTLQIQNICDARRFKLADDIEREIGRLPTSLKESYDSIYKSVNTLPFTARCVAKRVISWLFCSQRPLKAPELIAAVAVDGLKDPTSKDQVLDICCNLVVFDSAADHFRFAHLSVREYLESLLEYSLAEVHLEACYACLNTWNIPKVERKKLPQGWIGYTAENLLRHLRQLDSVNPSDLGGLDDSLQRFIGTEFKSGVPCHDWADLCYFSGGLPNLTMKAGKLGLKRDLHEELILSHPLSLLAALGITTATDRILRMGTLRLDQGQREECVTVAAVCKQLPTLKLLVQKHFSIPLRLTLRLLEHFPGRIPRKAPNDLHKHLTEELVEIILKTTPTVTNDMLHAACRNKTMSCQIVQQLCKHDPGLKMTQQHFETVILNGNTELFNLVVPRVSSVTVTQSVLEEVGRHWEDVGKRAFIHILDYEGTRVESSKGVFHAIARFYDPRHFNDFLHRTDFQENWITRRLFKRARENKIWRTEILEALKGYNSERFSKYAPFVTIHDSNAWRERLEQRRREAARGALVIESGDDTDQELEISIPKEDSSSAAGKPYVKNHNTRVPASERFRRLSPPASAGESDADGEREPFNA